MRTYPFTLAAILALAVALPSLAAEKPRSAQANQYHPRKIWTNDDTDLLHSRGLISIVGQEPNAATSAATSPSESPMPLYKSRLEDPAWYAERTAGLQDELEKREAALREQQDALAGAVKGVTQPGISMDRPSAGVTPEAGLANLLAQVREVQNQLDELSDLARQNNISPGVLRG